uniref:Uncharacterized protein n=1 Tax=viral metagenome TaxID=1070528 RepID=A0A6C0D0D1_9ZZZZ
MACTTFRRGYMNLLFKQIKQRCYEIKDIRNLITVNGETQNKEKLSIKLIKDVLDGMNLKYTQAGSQQSKDFRNVHRGVKSLSINIEVKKTDNKIIYFNDTLPSCDIYYIIFYTGKKFKRATKNDVQPQIIFINGYDLIKDDLELLNEYKKDIEYMKNKWGRKGTDGNACKFKHFSVYPRPTYKTDITYLLNSEQSVVLEEVAQHCLSEQSV